MENKQEYDYNTPIENTSVELAKMILAKLDTSKDGMIIASYEKLDPIGKAAFAESATDFSIEIMREIAKSDLPYPYATRPIDKIIQVLESLKQYINGSVTQARHELASRSLGVKDPENGRYTEEEATIGVLMLKLEEVRESQGNDRKDYFNDAPVTPAATTEPATDVAPADTATADTTAQAAAPAAENAGADLSTNTDTTK